MPGGKQRKGALTLSKLGHLKMVMHRPLTGLPKTATVKRTPTGKWSSFFAQLLSKGEEASRAVVRVNPAHTSQTCSSCGHRQEMPLSVRVYECPSCSLIIDRDHNGSKNIAAEALKAVGRHGRVIPEVPGW